jgi:hypothetical protein
VLWYLPVWHISKQFSHHGEGWVGFPYASLLLAKTTEDVLCTFVSTRGHCFNKCIKASAGTYLHITIHALCPSLSEADSQTPASMVPCWYALPIPLALVVSNQGSELVLHESRTAAHPAHFPSFHLLAQHSS